MLTVMDNPDNAQSLSGKRYLVVLTTLGESVRLGNLVYVRPRGSWEAGVRRAKTKAAQRNARTGKT